VSKIAVGLQCVETFVYAELLKQTTNARSDISYSITEITIIRSRCGCRESGGQLVGVEIKAAATIKESDLRGLKRLASVAKDKFMLGSSFTMALKPCLGDCLWAAPISTLWDDASITIFPVVWLVVAKNEHEIT